MYGRLGERFIVGRRHAFPLEHGRKLYHDAEYAEAIVALDQYLSSADVPQARRIDAMLIVAFSHAALGNEGSAKRWFVEVLRIDETVRLPIDLSPKLLRLFEQARAQYEAEKQKQSKVVAPPAAIAVAPKTEPRVSAPVYKRWWFWTIASVVVVGAAGATTAYLLTRPQNGGLDLTFRAPP